MFDITKQIQYWIEGADSDFETAGFLIQEKKKILHGLFFCHLSIEKAIKAHVVKNTLEVPPRSHDLLYLVGKTSLELNQEQKKFLGLLMKYQLEGRYPEYQPIIPDINIINGYFLKAKQLLIWIKNKL